MRKLVLTSLTWKTGDLHCEGNRLVVVNSNGNDENDFNQAIERMKQWFPNNYPYSELISIVPHPTIDVDPSEDDRIEMYSREALVSFGRYLLSEARSSLILSQLPKAKDSGLEKEALKDVYHADVENWKAIKD